MYTCAYSMTSPFLKFIFSISEREQAQLGLVIAIYPSLSHSGIMGTYTPSVLQEEFEHEPGTVMYGQPCRASRFTTVHHPAPDVTLYSAIKRSLSTL